MNALKIFEHEEFGSVRVVEKDGEPWFVAKDVCEVLDIGNVTEATRALDDDEKGIFRITEGTSIDGGNPNMLIISESGLYFLIFRSRKPQARSFRKWVTGEVLPTMRKTGSYGQPALSREDILTQALQIVGHENEALSRMVEDMSPKADFADAVSEAGGGVSVNRFAKVLSQHGIKNMGSHRLYNELRKDGFVIRQEGKNWNTPKQKYMDKGWFRIIEYLTDEDDSIQFITSSFVITGKGQQALLSHFMDKYGINRQLNLFDRYGNGRAKVIPMNRREMVQ